MNVEQPEPDDGYAQLLAACDDALAAGSSAERVCQDALSPEVRARLEKEAAWCGMVRQLLSPKPVRPAGAARETPRTLGRFQLLRELGQGTFGVVFLAHDPLLRRDIALKIPHMEVLLTAELRDRFRHEARVAAGLNHPRIVPVYDAGEEGGICYIASAFCPGITLAAWLRQRTAPVPPTVAADIVRCLAEAVEHAHQRGVLHRDLKPANVIVDPERSLLDTLHITDFGLAKLWLAGQDTLNVSPRTHTGAILGTPNYMAPEQALGQNAAVVPATDVHALGAILYELLTGRPPYQADTVFDTLVLLRTEEPLEPNRLRPRLPRDLETICLKCLRKDPAQRYASAAALAEDLRRYLAGEPIVARRRGPVQRVALWCRRRPTLVASVTLSLLAALLVAGIAYQEVRQERDRYRNERDRAERNLARALVGETRGLLQTREAGWWWKAFDNLGMAASLSHGQTEREELRELAGACMGSASLCFRLATTWHGHDSAVTAVALHPNQQQAASGSADGNIILWNLPAATRRALLLEKGSAITRLAFHPTGRLLAAANVDGQVSIWEFQDAKQVPSGATRLEPRQVFDLGAGSIRALGFNPQGTLLVAGCRDGTVRLLDLDPTTATLKGSPWRVLTSSTAEIVALAFSPVEPVVAASCTDLTIRFWDLAGGGIIDSFALPHVAQTICYDTIGENLMIGDFESYGFRVRRLRRRTENVFYHVHPGGVLHVQPRADGCFLSASTEGTLKVWMPARSQPPSQEPARATVEGATLRAVASAPDLGLTLGGYRDGILRLWEIYDPPHRWVLGSSDPPVAFLDNHRLANSRQIIDLKPGGGSSRRVFFPAMISAQDLAPNDQILALGSGDGLVRLWNLAADRELTRWQAHPSDLTALVYDPPGQRLASAARDGMVRIWDVATQRLLTEVLTDVGPVDSLAWSRDGQRLAASGRRGVVLWSASETKPPRRISDHSLQTSTLAFGDDVLATGEADGAIVLRDSHTGTIRSRLTGLQKAITRIAFAADGVQLVASAQGGALAWWNSKTGKELGTLPQPDQSFSLICLDPAGRYALTRGLELRVWDLKTQTVLARLHNLECTSACFRRSNSAFYLGTNQGSIVCCTTAEIEATRAGARLHDATDPVRFDPVTIVVPGGHTDGIWGMAASPDGRWLVTGCHDQSVKLWQTDPPRLVRTWVPTKHLIWSIAFSTDGTRVASGSAYEESGAVDIFEVSTGRHLRQFTSHRGLVTGIAFHPRHPWIASTAGDGTVYLSNLETGQQQLLHDFKRSVRGAAFSPDGTWLAVGLPDREVGLWHFSGTPSGPAETTRRLKGHPHDVWAVTFSPDGRYLASGSDQGVVILWDAATFERRITLRGGAGQIRSLSFSPDCRLLATGAYMSPAIVWNLPVVRASLAEMQLDW